MCGRFASARKRQELLEEFGVQRDRVTEPLRPDYNVAPTKPVYAVVTRLPKDGEDGSAESGRGEDGSAESGRGERSPGEDGSAESGRGEDGSAESGRGEAVPASAVPASTGPQITGGCGNCGWSAGGSCRSGPRTSRSAAA